MAQPPLSNAVVFAVDDEQINLDLLRRTLSRICQLETFADSSDALAAARVRSPDLILLDYRMPGRSGTELLAEMRAAGVDSAVVFLTAYPEDAAVQSVVKSEDVFWVAAKPYNPDHLRSQVSMALSLVRIRSRQKNVAAAK